MSASARNHHGSDLKFCGCGSCRRGMHHKPGSGWVVDYTRRKWRRLVKKMLKEGEEDIPEHFSVPYTD
jgi:hypothetical protein